MEITSSGVSVYEVVLDLNHWDGLLSHEIPGFVDNLIRLMPSTAQHKCMSGQAGGFHEELTKGTNFGHVVEHVLLELIQLADAEHTEYSGWTKSLGKGRYVIHYGAPDFLTGRLAAILAVEIVGKLQQGEMPDLEFYLDQMRDPREDFTGQQSHQLDLQDGAEPEWLTMARDQVPELSDWQRENLGRIFAEIRDRLADVNQRWSHAFITFGGEFARGILDKIELIHPDRSLPCLIAGRFDNYFRSVANICQMMRAMRIPLNFVTHAAWLYKNVLQVVILEKLADDHDKQMATIWDFDDFYQIIFHAIISGFTQSDEPPAKKGDVAVCGFRARHVRQESVLVIDDDAMARKVARSILEYHDITTRGAREGLEALNILADEGTAIGVVLLDLIMPGMDGRAVCRRIRESHPHIRIILCSGYPLSRVDQCCLDEHAVSFLQKPFATATLIDLVRDLMDLPVAEGEEKVPVHPTTEIRPPDPTGSDSRIEDESRDEV